MSITETFNLLLTDHPFLLGGAFLILVISLVLMHVAIRLFNLRRPTIPAIFYFTYLVMIVFASFRVFLEKPEPYRNTYMFAVLSLLITVPTGILAANRMFKFRQGETEKFFSSPLEESKPSRHAFVAHLLLVAIAGAMLLIYLHQVGTTPLQYLIQHPGEVAELTLLREQSFKLLDPRWATATSSNLFFIYLFLRTLLFPFLILTTFGYYLFSREKKWFWLALSTFGMGVFYAASSIARAPVAAIFMRLFFFYYLFKRKVSRKVLMFFLVLIIGFPLLVTTFAYTRNNQINQGLQQIGRRLTYTPALDLYYYFEIFPDNHPYLYGQTLVKPFLELMGVPFFYVENYVHRYISPNAPESGHANAAFLSNLHADFGVIGVIFGGFFTGVLMQLLHIYFVRQRKTIYTIAVYAYLIYAIWVLNFGSITSVLFVNGVLPILFFPALMRTITSFFGRATTHKI